MKRKMTIKELVEALKSQQLRKKDLVVPNDYLFMENGKMKIKNVANSNELSELLLNTGISTMSNVSGHPEMVRTLSLDILGIAHSQIASKLQIPKLYYEKLMQEKNIPLLDQNVNHWLRQQEQNYLLRTFIDKEEETGIMRAMLSDRFKVIDNFDVLMAALEAIQQSGVEVNIVDADLTDSKMYVRFEAPSIVKESKELLSRYKVPLDGGDDGNSGIAAGFILTNSEVGSGTFTIAPRIIVLACRNGMTITKDSFKKVHLGGKLEEYSEISWSEETKQKNLELIVAQTKDAVKTYISPEYLGRVVSHLEENGTKKLEHPMDAIKNVSREFAFSEEKEKRILDYFISGADSTPFGIAQAVTFYAHKDANADEQYELEKVSVAIIENAKTFDKPMVERRKKTDSKSFLLN